MQQLIFAWQYTYLGNPDKAKDTIMGIMTIARIFKNLFFFPIESVVITLFLKVLVPVTARMRITYDHNADMRFTKKQIVALVLLMAIGAGSAVSYLTYYYDNNSVTKDYSAEQVIERNKAMHAIIVDKDPSVEEGRTVAVIEYASKPFWGSETTYTVALYQVKEGAELTEDMWSLKKTPASKHQDLQRIATVTIVATNAADVVTSFELEPKQ